MVCCGAVRGACMMCVRYAVDLMCTLLSFEGLEILHDCAQAVLRGQYNQEPGKLSNFIKSCSVKLQTIEDQYLESWIENLGDQLIDVAPLPGITVLYMVLSNAPLLKSANLFSFFFNVDAGRKHEQKDHKEPSCILKSHHHPGGRNDLALVHVSMLNNS